MSTARKIAEEIGQSIRGMFFGEEAADMISAKAEAILSRHLQEWVSVEKDLPKDFDNYLVAHTDTRDGNPVVEEARYCGDREWALVRTDGYNDAIVLREQVRYWMPIPKPPKED